MERATHAIIFPAECGCRRELARTQRGANLRGDIPASIGIVDDVLTAGDVILQRFPDSNVVGFFIARRILTSPFGEVGLNDRLPSSERAVD
jgi:hypothetical protein